MRGPLSFFTQRNNLFLFFSIKSKARRRSILFYFSQKLWDRLTGLEISGHKGHKSMAKKKRRKRQDFYEVAWLANNLCVKEKLKENLRYLQCLISTLEVPRYNFEVLSSIDKWVAHCYNAREKTSTKVSFSPCNKIKMNVFQSVHCNFSGVEKKKVGSHLRKSNFDSFLLR